MESLRSNYHSKIKLHLKKDLGLTNVMSVPKLLKIVINCSLGEALKDKKVIESMSTQLAIITGQKPQVRRATKSISSFKLRQGEIIGLKATLRGARMYTFLTKLISLALPRVRDFRGISRTGFDGYGNYTLGIAEQTIFPELEYKLVDKIRGFEITFVTSAQTDQAAFELLKALGMPFQKEDI
ncbi:50S ribosomal protein L5 [Candidatus Gottesmanbacteria bacterium RBG_16_43_7]|uniref:Large ribosomal subunit protein uL5 n=1 Tax=Candidatus Gottesmanbacteria bacterium RBG_16_43_7 TaxID=1798373 RepID=A0A1F5ZAE3_9BACT|nr:MAG: 50S ribosomal protein L5 [Candidatus Gottesmanbacteria bacterium RBG_16_43_7]